MYFYFDFNDKEKQKVENLLRSLIAQLSSQRTRPSKALAKLYTESCDGKEPAKFHDLWDILEEMFSECGHIYILLDALDECAERSLLLKWLHEIFKQHFGQLHLLVLSRKERDIEEALIDMGVHAISIANADVDFDIRIFIEDQLANRVGLSKRPMDVKAEITEALMKNAKGMYDCLLIDFITALIKEKVPLGRLSTGCIAELLKH
jgi:hypothetical protein